nr:unnamed protein product [Callosobruchus analis]
MNIKINTHSDAVHNYLNQLSYHNFISMINKPTRVYGTTTNCLDHIFMKSNIPHFEHGCVSMVFDNSVTDHRATIIGLPTDPLSPQFTINSRRTFQTNYSNLNNDILNYDWDNYYNETDVNRLTEMFSSVLNILITKKYKNNDIKRCNLKRKHWITAGMINSVNKRNRLHSEYKHNPNNEEKRKTYAEKIEKPNTHPPPRSINQNSFFLEPTSEIEINKTISLLKNKKSTGFDNLKTEMLKNVSDSVAKPLNHLINTIFITGKVPYQFKVAVVTPVHRKGDKKNINNYRPISVISVLAKVFEKVLKNRLNKFLTLHNVISEKQFGFREALSTK